MIRKLVIGDGRTEREMLLVSTIVVGRDPTCQINDLDPLLSRRHAEFVADDQGAIIRDLSSRNGVFVNGVKVPEQKLADGDVVQLGHLHVRYVEDATPQAKDMHQRTHATTTIGMEAPTMAPVRPRAQPPAPVPPPFPSATPEDPTKADADADTTIAKAPPENETVAAPAPAPAQARRPSADDIDATRAPAAPVVAPAVKKPAIAPAWDTSTPDPDSTMVPGMDVTRAPNPGPRGAAPVKAAPATDARVMANGRLVVTDASPSCAQVIGARAETIIGGGLADVLTRTLMFVATGDGPSAISLSVVRAESGGITVTFKTGQGTKS